MDCLRYLSYGELVFWMVLSNRSDQPDITPTNKMLTFTEYQNSLPEPVVNLMNS